MDIKEIREMTALSQNRFAEAYGIPIGTLHHWEAGERKPPEYVLELISRIAQLQALNIKAYVFSEYRDSKGVGSHKTFKRMTEAIQYAAQGWDHMSNSDRESYKKDSAPEFFVGEASMVWDEDELEYIIDPETIEVIQRWV